MKKIILGAILILSSQIALGMVNESEVESIFSKLAAHIPELKLLPIKIGMRQALDSNPDPAKAIINTVQYINGITSTEKSWYSQKAELIEALKDLAKEKFASEYMNLSKEELDQKLNEAIYALEASGKKFSNKLSPEYYNGIRKSIAQNESSERDEIVKLIIAGADPNVIGTKSIIPGVKSVRHGLLQLMAGLEDVNAVRLLIAYGANVNRLTGGEYPLGAAIRGIYGHLDIEKAKKIIELLIKAGANVNENNQGTNLAVGIATMGDLSLLETVLQNGAKLSKIDIDRIKSIIYKPDDILNILKKYGYEV